MQKSKQNKRMVLVSAICIAILVIVIYVEYDVIGSGVNNDQTQNSEKDSGKWIDTFTKVDLEGIHEKTILTDSIGNIYVAGYFSSTVDFDPSNNKLELKSNGLTDIFFLKYDYRGKLIWAHSIGGPGGDMVNAMKVDELGNMMLVGYIENDVDIDPSKDVRIFTVNGFRDSFVAKYDQDGKFLWGHSFGGPDDGASFTKNSTHYDEGLDLDFDKEGNAYVVGRFNGIIDLDPTTNQFLISSEGTDGYVAKYSPDGVLLWAFRIGGQGFDQVLKVSLSIDDRDIYVSGTFEQSVDFDPSDASAIKTVEDSDSFACKYDSRGIFFWCGTLKGARQELPRALGADTCDIYECDLKY